MIRKWQIAVPVVLVLLSLSVGIAWAADQPQSSVQTRPVQLFPKVGPYEVLCGDFHIHTKYSDGSRTPQERVLEAWQHGLDAIAITDHGKVDAYRDALPTANALGLVLIRGWETGLDRKEHLVVLGPAEPCGPRDSHRWSETPGPDRAFYQDELRAIAKAGGVVVFAHPHVGFREPVRWGIQQGIIRGIEVMNGVVGQGWNTIESHGTWCYPNGFEWGLENNLGFFANSDLHGARQGRPPVITLVLAKQRTPASVLEAIRNRRTIAWFNGMLWGSPKLLSDLMKSLVAVRSTVGQDGQLRLQLQNRSPVAMKATLQNGCSSQTTVDVAPYQEVLLDCGAPAGKLGIKWDNIWVSPKENLFTTHELRRT